jgi:hypothetical protein
MDLMGWTTKSIRLAAQVRQRAQSTVEWVIGAAVLAFIGMAAWTSAGAAITAAFTRMVAILNSAGV